MLRSLLYSVEIGSQNKTGVNYARNIILTLLQSGWTRTVRLPYFFTSQNDNKNSQRMLVRISFYLNISLIMASSYCAPIYAHPVLNLSEPSWRKFSLTQLCVKRDIWGIATGSGIRARQPRLWYMDTYVPGLPVILSTRENCKLIFVSPFLLGICKLAVQLVSLQTGHPFFLLILPLPLFCLFIIHGDFWLLFPRKPQT